MKDHGTWSKEVFARNLKFYMKRSGMNQKEMAQIVGVSAPAFCEWLNAKKYPRIDKIEILANYFGILKSDLIEDKSSKENLPTEEKLTDGEKVWLDLYRKTPESSREMLMLLFQSFENIPESSQQMVLGMLRVVEKEKK